MCDMQSGPAKLGIACNGQEEADHEHRGDAHHQKTFEQNAPPHIASKKISSFHDSTFAFSFHHNCFCLTHKLCSRNLCFSIISGTLLLRGKIHNFVSWDAYWSELVPTNKLRISSHGLNIFLPNTK